jgi:hypothetical protein
MPRTIVFCPFIFCLLFSALLAFKKNLLLLCKYDHMDHMARNKARQPIISRELKGGHPLIFEGAIFWGKRHGTFPILTLAGFELVIRGKGLLGDEPLVGSKMTPCFTTNCC